MIYFNSYCPLLINHSIDHQTTTPTSTLRSCYANPIKIKSRPQSQPNRTEPPPLLIGRSGMALFGTKNPKWYPCVVEKDNTYGTIKVQWDDDKTFTERLPPKNFRPDAPTSSSSTEHNEHEITPRPYPKPILPANFRDTSTTTTLLRPNTLLRSAEPTFATTSLSLSPATPTRTLITLSRSPPDLSSVPTTHLQHIMIPAKKNVECYQTSLPEVRRWIQEAVGAICTATPPILVHCKKGKDRTGVVVAVCLLAVGVEEEMVREDYGRSGGVEGRDWELFGMTLEGVRQFGGVERYLGGKMDLRRLREMLRPG